MLELMHSLGAAGDTTAGGVVNAARQAGATEVVDGTLYARPDGSLRLDLRRVDLATGAIGDVQTVEGNDLFALVDSGTTRLLTTLGVPVPAGSVAHVEGVIASEYFELLKPPALMALLTAVVTNCVVAPLTIARRAPSREAPCRVFFTKK